MRQFILGFATLAIATSAHAGSQSNFKVLGFSADNKTIAFANTAISDGSGYGIAEISVVNVAKNALVASARGEDDNESNASEAVALKNALSKINLGKYGIVAGQNTGKTLLSRLPTDYSTTTNTVFSVQSWAQGGASSLVPKYELKIATAAATCAQAGEAASAMTLVLTNKEGEATPVNLILQKDSSVLPKSRGCATNYRVMKVIKSGSALVVDVEYSSPGFEGPDTQHIVVTAQQELK